MGVVSCALQCWVYSAQRILEETMHCMNIIFELCPATIDCEEQRAIDLRRLFRVGRVVNGKKREEAPVHPAHQPLS